MRDIARIGVVLMLIAAVSGGALAYAHSVTAPAIQRALQAAKEDALARALPGAREFQDRTGEYASLLADPRFRDVKEVWAAGSAGSVVVVAPTGYGGPITCLVGVDASGKVQGLEILSAPGETPGLGSRVKEVSFTDRFRGQAGRVQVQAITGATISSRAVISGVQAALDLLAARGGK